MARDIFITAGKDEKFRNTIEVMCKMYEGKILIPDYHWKMENETQNDEAL